ncbi:unnamed protein product [Ophioblennius macclurei]
MKDGSQKPLIRQQGAREGTDMDGGHRCDCCDSSCVFKGTGAAMGYPPWQAPAPRRTEARLLRMAQLLVAGLLLVTAGSLALLFTVGLRGRCATEKQPDISGESEMSKHHSGEVAEKPSAMLTAPRMKKIDGNRLNWEIKVGAICRGGFGCYDSGLVTPRSGIYRIFLQITWRNEKTCPEAVLNLSSVVLEFSDAYPKDMEVLSMVDTVSCRNPWTKSLFASRLVKLHANSRLHVNATFPQMISEDDNQVYFGAEFIDD